jgi:hypothetical protein
MVRKNMILLKIINTRNSAHSTERMIGTITARVQLEKICGREFQRAWRQHEMIGAKPPVVR